MKAGIIGGSGLYDMENLEDVEEIELTTPFGPPSDAYVSGKLHGIPVVFLPRHGKGHRILPTDIPFLANIWGFKKLGVTHLISVGAVGSLKKEIAPGHIVFPDQFIDLTRQRRSTFFGNGIVVHAQFGHPVCSEFTKVLVEAAQIVGATFHVGGTYVCMEGPLFSTQAESNLYRSWGASIIGMTNAQEAKLAREAEMAFATIALATDYDCWYEGEEEVTIEQILKVMHENVATSKKIIEQTMKLLTPDFPCSQKNALEYSIVTQRDKIPAKVRENLDILIGKYLL